MNSRKRYHVDVDRLSRIEEDLERFSLYGDQQQEVQQASPLPTEQTLPPGNMHQNQQALLNSVTAKSLSTNQGFHSIIRDNQTTGPQPPLELPQSQILLQHPNYPQLNKQHLLETQHQLRHVNADKQYCQLNNQEANGPYSDHYQHLADFVSGPVLSAEDDTVSEKRYVGSSDVDLATIEGLKFLKEKYDSLGKVKISKPPNPAPNSSEISSTQPQFQYNPGPERYRQAGTPQSNEFQLNHFIQQQTPVSQFEQGMIYQQNMQRFRNEAHERHQEMLEREFDTSCGQTDYKQVEMPKQPAEAQHHHQMRQSPQCYQLQVLQQISQHASHVTQHAPQVQHQALQQSVHQAPQVQHQALQQSVHHAPQVQHQALQQNVQHAAQVQHQVLHQTAQHAPHAQHQVLKQAPQQTQQELPQEPHQQHTHLPDKNLLNDQDLMQVDIFYRSQRSEVFVSRCCANLALGPRWSFQSTGSLGGSPASGVRHLCRNFRDWVCVKSGIPVLVLDTAKTELNLILAEIGSGFALWRNRVGPLTGYSVIAADFHALRTDPSMQRSLAGSSSPSTLTTSIVGINFANLDCAEEFYKNVVKFSAVASSPGTSLSANRNRHVSGDQVKMSPQRDHTLSNSTHDLQVSSVPSSKQGNDKSKSSKKNKKLSSKSFSKSDISQPCCFTHVTKLGDRFKDGPSRLFLTTSDTNVLLRNSSSADKSRRF